MTEIVSGSQSSIQKSVPRSFKLQQLSLFDTYENVLRDIDKLVPVKMTAIRRQPIAVWFDDESRLLRRKSRLSERRYRRIGLASDRLLWVQHERARHEVNRIKENGCWLACISEHSGQPRKLWRTFSSITGLDYVSTTTNGSPTA